MAHFVNCENVVRTTLRDLGLQQPHTYQVDVVASVQLLISIIQDQLSAWPPRNIRDYVKRIFPLFMRASYSGVPFARIEQNLAKQVLEMSLLVQSSSAIGNFLYLKKREWMDEDDLDFSFAAIFSSFKKEGVKEAVCHLWNDYKRGDHRAGYYLLWLCKRVSNASYKLPSVQEDFGLSTVGKVLSAYVRDARQMPPFFLSLLLIGGEQSRCFFAKHVLEADAYAKLLQKNYTHLQTTGNYPNKKKEILHGLLYGENTRELAEVLCNCDRESAHIGRLVLEVLNAPSYRDALPHLYKLQEILPQIQEEKRVEKIFGIPWILFRKEEESRYAKKVARGCLVLFGQDDQLIAFYDPLLRGMPSYLLAFDKTSKKTLWGVPLKRDEFFYQSSCGYVVLGCNGEKEISLLSQKTGEFCKKITTFVPLKSHFGGVYLSPGGKCLYQWEISADRQYLYGGRPQETESLLSFKESFSTESTVAFLSTHIGFFNFFEKALYVYDYKGHKMRLDCQLYSMYGDQFYVVSPDNFLNVWKLASEEGVIATSMREMILLEEDYRSIWACEGGQIIFMTFKGDLLFLDENSEEIITGEHRVYDDHIFINQKTAEVWAWDKDTQEIWKISRQGALCKGHLSYKEVKLLYAEMECIYFTQN